MFNYTKHSISKKDIIEVTKVLKKYPLTQGGIVEKFEKKLYKKFKFKYSLAVNNATSALTLLNLFQRPHRSLKNRCCSFLKKN